MNNRITILKNDEKWIIYYSFIRICIRVFNQIIRNSNILNKIIDFLFICLFVFFDINILHRKNCRIKLRSAQHGVPSLIMVIWIRIWDWSCTQNCFAQILGHKNCHFINRMFFSNYSKWTHNLLVALFLEISSLKNKSVFTSATLLHIIWILRL